VFWPHSIGRGGARHALQRARDERETAAQVAALQAELAEASVHIIERPGHDDRRTVKGLEELVTDKGKQITPASHASCPGHAAYIANDWRGARIVYVCTQWTQAGQRDRYNSGARPASAPMTEAEKQDRREVIANNKASKSAETVRRQWLQRFLTRKSAPNGAAAYLAGELARGIWELRRAMERSHQLAATLLGLDHSKGQRDVIATASAVATDARAVVIALAVVLGDIEESTGPHTWRNPSDTIRRYFGFLAENCYALSDVEQLAAGRPRRKRRSAATNDATTAA
jgi:ParB family chromosome partitioning protein